MFEDENEEVETSVETQEEEVVEVQEDDTIEEEETTETQIDWEARAKKAEAAIEKAKQKAKTAPAAKPTPGELSTAEIIALSKSNVEADDIEEVIEYARFKKISVTEALKSPVVKATLAENAELRKSASAVNTNQGRRASSGAISDEKLLANARNGIMPESEADVARLFNLRMKNK